MTAILKPVPWSPSGAGARPVPRMSRTLRRFLSNLPAMLGAGFLLVLIVMAFLSPLVAPYDPNAQDLLQTLQAPSSAHWLGTDRFGRDLFSRLLVGSRVTLLAGFEGVAVAVLFGVPTGLLAGYIGGRIGFVSNWFSETLMSMPPFVLALAIIGVRGPGLTNAMLAIGVILSPRMFRVARAAAMAIRNETYFEAARASGCTTWRIVWSHVLPNASGPLLVQASFAVGLAVLYESALSFLGLGAPVPTASWGSMIHDAYQALFKTSLGIFPPSIMIIATVYAFATIGDGMRDALGRDSRVSDR
ncbi:MAG TPA: ABC transporter permease [Ramlibacter sp.]|nr:ABC transporter permease [Ramlibacter sp.]